MTMETHRTGGNMAAEAKSEPTIEEAFIDDKKASMDELKKMSPATIKEMKVKKMGNGKRHIIVTLEKIGAAKRIDRWESRDKTTTPRHLFIYS